MGSRDRTPEEKRRHAQHLQAIGGLAQAVTHELNNALTVVLGSADLQLLQLSEEPARSLAESIQQAACRAAILVSDLSFLGESGAPGAQAVDVNAILARCSRLMSRVLGEDIQIETSLAPDLAPVKADAARLEQLLLILALATRDAMPEGGKLTIETANVGTPFASVSVCFALGTAVSSVEEPELVPSFLMAREIAEFLGGRAEREERLGGLAHALYLPLAEQPLAVADSFRGAGLREGSETVLVVDDDDMTRAVVQNLLASHGYSVLVARDAAQALLMCQEHPCEIHLALADVVMPGTSGRELAERLRRLRPNLKVLYMSGYPQDVLDLHGLQGIGVLTKPFSSTELLSRAREILDLSENIAR